MDLATFGRLLAACAVVACVLYVLKVVARAAVRTAATPLPGGRLIAVLETAALPEAAALHLVRVAERYYVIGRSATAVTMLCEIAPEVVRAALPIAPATAPGRFGVFTALRRRVLGAAARRD